MLEDGVSGVTGFNFAIYGKANTGVWAVPDFVITLARAFEAASSTMENFLELG